MRSEVPPVLSLTSASELPRLACLAARELDDRLAGVSSDLIAARRLADHLAIVIPEDLADPTTTFALAAALRETNFAKREPRTVADLRASAQQVRTGLAQIASSTSDDDLRRMRDLCIAISRYALAHVSDDAEPGHPFRS
jgi:hypothetical protein